MLTARGWWFLFLAAMLALVGVVIVAWYSSTVALLGLSLVLWFFAEWLLFALRFRSSADQIAVERVVLQGDRVVPAVWVGITFTVRITITPTGPMRMPFVIVEDHPSADLPPTGSTNIGAFDVVPDEPAVIEYQLKAESPGLLRFEGVTIRISDAAGLFYQRLFIRLPEEYLVLPPLTDDEGHQRGTKRFNTLPPPGVHRLRRAGGGSELLDLRDYRPGDPPKMIAWKPSARRDKLITKELENDVPVRCVLFLDASNGARVGPPGHAPVVRLSAIAAGIAQAAAGNRDLVGLTVFDEHTADVSKPARTRVHTIQMLRKFGEAAAKLPHPGFIDVDLLSRYAYPVAQQLYPDLLRKDVNSRPFGLFWRPIADSRWLYVVLFLFFLPLLLLVPDVLNFFAKVVTSLLPARWGIIPKLALTFVMLMLPYLLAFGVWFLHGVRGFLPPYLGRTSRRKQLGALYAALDNSGPASIERYIHHDVFFANRTTQFLLDHRIRLPLVLHDRDGNYRFHSPEKVEVLADQLVRSVTRARDNELYVILADLLGVSDQLKPVVQTVQMARARHHQIVVLIPWPADVPPPDGEAEESPQQLKIGTLVRSVMIARYHKAYAQLRSSLTRAGALVVRVEDGDPVQLILDRLDRLRGVRVRR